MSLGGWKYAASSVVGTSHQKKPDGVCQDSHSCRCLNDPSPVLIVVVSDGAGSASHSQLGSRVTCEFVGDSVANAEPGARCTSDFALDVLEGLRSQLGRIATDAGVAIREFACTLLVAIIEDGRAIFWQIGDGAICFRVNGTENYEYAFWPEKGDYANVTFFVTDANADQHLEFDVTDGEIVEIAAFSDGLERLALDFVAGEVHSGFFNGLFPYMRSLEPGQSDSMSLQLATFLGSERVNKRTDDDKTLVLASRAQ